MIFNAATVVFLLNSITNFFLFSFIIVEAHNLCKKIYVWLIQSQLNIKGKNIYVYCGKYHMKMKLKIIIIWKLKLMCKTCWSYSTLPITLEEKTTLKFAYITEIITETLQAILSHGKMLLLKLFMNHHHKSTAKS